MSKQGIGWAERAGRAIADAEKHKPLGTHLTRPEGWRPGGSRWAPGFLRPPTGGQLEQSHRASKRSHERAALGRKLDQVLGTETDE